MGKHMEIYEKLWTLLLDKTHTQVPVLLHAYTLYSSVPKFVLAWKIAVWK